MTNLLEEVQTIRTQNEAGKTLEAIQKDALRRSRALARMDAHLSGLPPPGADVIMLRGAKSTSRRRIPSGMKRAALNVYGGIGVVDRKTRDQVKTKPVESRQSESESDVEENEGMTPEWRQKPMYETLADAFFDHEPSVSPELAVDFCDEALLSLSDSSTAFAREGKE
jgi:hypothetical protein